MAFFASGGRYWAGQHTVDEPSLHQNPQNVFFQEWTRKLERQQDELLTKEHQVKHDRLELDKREKKLKQRELELEGKEKRIGQQEESVEMWYVVDSCVQLSS